MIFGLQNFLTTCPVPSRYPKFLSLPDPIQSKTTTRQALDMCNCNSGVTASASDDDNVLMSLSIKKKIYVHWQKCSTLYIRKPVELAVWGNKLLPFPMVLPLVLVRIPSFKARQSNEKYHRQSPLILLELCNRVKCFAKYVFMLLLLLLLLRRSHMRKI